MSNDIILEQLDNVSDEELYKLISAYRGNNSFMLSLRDNFKKRGFLTPKQLLAARKFFDTEIKNNSPSFHLVKTNPYYRKMVVKKGTEAYLDLIKTDKKYLFQEGDTKISAPTKTWALRNISDLQNLYDDLGEVNRKKVIRLVTGEQGEFGDLIKEQINKLENDLDSYSAFIDKNGDWSILNRIDSNWSNWADAIALFDVENRLNGTNPSEKIQDFFKQKPVLEIFTPEEMSKLESIEKDKGIKIGTMSLAEYYIFKDSLNGYKNSLSVITEKTKKGEKSERQFISYLYLSTLFRNEKSIEPNDIHNFSSYGNRVDQVFGIDLMVNMLFPDGKGGSVKKWVPIQVKSDRSQAETAFILSLGVDGLALYKRNQEVESGTSQEQQEKIEDWGFYVNYNGKEYSFNKSIISLYGE